VPRPVSDSIADGLPLWDTYEALFFLLTGISLGIVLGFLFPSVWRSFRRRFRKLERYKPDKVVAAPWVGSTGLRILATDSLGAENEEAQTDIDLVTLFVSARYAVQEKSMREAAALYLQILGSEKVTRVQTNKAMFELVQVYAASGLTAKALETGLELLHRKPTHTDVFKLLLEMASAKGEESHLENLVKIYSGAVSGELAREVAHLLSGSSLRLMRQNDVESHNTAVRLAKLAVRWCPNAIEPKLTLVEATSVLWRVSEDRPVDQWFMGFCVDLLEAARLRRANPNLSPFAYAPLLKAWSAKLQSQGQELDTAVQRMRAEIQAQMQLEHSAEPGLATADYDFAWTVFDALRREASPQNPMAMPSWEARLRTLLKASERPKTLNFLHACTSCAQLQRDFSWRCSGCKRWETLQPWALHES
jgi:lipopolysaccharide biosynthesis regulator YciM